MNYFERQEKQIKKEARKLLGIFKRRFCIKIQDCWAKTRFAHYRIKWDDPKLKEWTNKIQTTYDKEICYAFGALFGNSFLSFVNYHGDDNITK